MLDPPSQISRARLIRVILPNFPSRTQSFIAQELRSLERLGHVLSIDVLRAYGNDLADTGVATQITAPVYYPERNFVVRLGNVLNAILFCRKLPGFNAARRAMTADLRASRRLTPIMNFASALLISQKVDAGCDVLYAQFLSHPASVARYTSLMTNVPWVCSAHARDIWLAPDWDLANKVNDARWIAACTTVGVAHLQKHAIEPDRIKPIYHGVDDSRFPRFERKASKANGSSKALQVKLLAVGRIVAKKGFGDLLVALSLLPPSLKWSLHLIGVGRGASSLKKQAHELGLSDRVTFAGFKPPEKLTEEYRKRDVFILPCIIDRDGDMDGLPNALAEAASQAMACVTTNVSEIPKLFSHETHALLVSPQDPKALAQAIERVITDPQLRHRLGRTASTMIREKFDHKKHVMQLSHLFLEVDQKF